MSLKIWLPLNGNIENQGLADVTITNNGATIDNNGKIGKCYSFNGGTITAPAPKITNKITVAAWIKAPDNNSGWRRVCGMQSAAISWQSASALLMLNGTNLYFSISNGSTCTSGGCVFNIDDSSNWFHACGTYDGTTARLYVNGVLKKECAIATTIENTPIWLGGTSAGERFTGKLNDFRLYDECLSADQIKEISRGMVLHYKMCQPERSENLLSNWCNITKWTTEGVSQVSVEPDSKFNKVLTFTPSSGTMRIYYSTSNVWTTNGATFTVSGYVKSSSASTMQFSRSIADYGASIATTTSWKKFSTVITLTSTSTTGTLSIQGSSGIKYYLANLKLERGTNPDPQWSPAPQDNPNWGTIEYDGSGFKNHGTVSGNVTLSADNPRYTGSYVFNGNDTSILIGDLSKLTPDGNFTMSCWIKKSEFSSKGYDTIFGGPSGFELESKNDTANERKFCAHNWGGGKWDYEFNKWYHLVMVRTSSNTKFYFSSESGFNNTPVITGDPGSIPSGNYYVGSWRSATEQNYKGLVSDFRIYATALDAIDVAELYKLGRN